MPGSCSSRWGVSVVDCPDLHAGCDDVLGTTTMKALDETVVPGAAELRFTPDGEQPGELGDGGFVPHRNILDPVVDRLRCLHRVSQLVFQGEGNTFAVAFAVRDKRRAPLAFAQLRPCLVSGVNASPVTRNAAAKPNQPTWAPVLANQPNKDGATIMLRSNPML